PEDVEGGAGGTLLERFGARVYRDYVLRQSQLFPRSVKLIMRPLRQEGGAVSEAFRAEYRERQGVLLPLCSWLGQNIRFGLLGAAAGVRERVEIVAVVDSAPALPPVDGIPLLSHRDQLAGLGPLDFIDICTPTASHLDLALWGLGQGYHVVCEKPVAVTRAEA